MIIGPLGSKGDHPLLERFHDARERPCLAVVTTNLNECWRVSFSQSPLGIITIEGSKAEAEATCRELVVQGFIPPGCGIVPANHEDRP
jgi:hypothetical protein